MRTLIVVLLIALFATTMFGQVKVQTRNPNSDINTYVYNLVNYGTYANNQKDTLPNRYGSDSVWATYGSTLPIGGKSFVAFKYFFKDSVIAYMHYDKRYRYSTTATDTATAWSNVFSDTLSHIADGAGQAVYEKVLRGGTDNDLMDCVDCEWRVVVQFTNTASKNGVTTPKYKVDLIWKP